MNIDADYVGEYYFEMNAMRETALEEIKLRKEFYDLEDMVQVTMEAYAKQYNKLPSLEEDLVYLDEAFNRLARGAIFLVASRERYASVRHQLYGEQEISAPENYQNIILEAMMKAREEFATRAEAGRYICAEQMSEDAKALGSKFLKEDSEFWLEMRYLFFNTNPKG